MIIVFTSAVHLGIRESVLKRVVDGADGLRIIISILFLIKDTTERQLISLKAWKAIALI